MVIVLTSEDFTKVSRLGGELMVNVVSVSRSSTHDWSIFLLRLTAATLMRPGDSAMRMSFLSNDLNLYFIRGVTICHNNDLIQWLIQFIVKIGSF